MSRVYSYSKYLVWTFWFYTATRLSYFSSGSVRLAITDTDSLLTSHERHRSDLEVREIELLKSTNKRIDYFQTHHAERFSQIYLKSFHRCLDFSSLNEVFRSWNNLHTHAQTKEQSLIIFCIPQTGFSAGTNFHERTSWGRWNQRTKKPQISDEEYVGLFGGENKEFKL